MWKILNFFKLEELKKIIKEILGVHLGIHDLSVIVTNKVMEYLDKYDKSMSDGEEHTFDTGRTVKNTDNDLLTKTGLKNIGVFGSFKNTSFDNSQEKVEGSFNEKWINLNDDGTFDISLKLIIFSGNYREKRKEIENVIVHELNHAITKTKIIGKTNKSRTLNLARTWMRNPTRTFQEKNPDIRKFMYNIYLSLPDEVNARVQEIGKELERLSTSSGHETMEALKKTKVFNDAKRMLDYSPELILSLDEKTLTDFIKIFNDTIKAIDTDNLKIPKLYNPTQFFSYWTKVINNSGEKLIRRIARLAANKELFDNNSISN